MRGRKPLPNVVKLQRASRQPRNPDEPVHRLAAGDPPAGLDEGSRLVWLEAVPGLARVGLFAVSDVGRVARTCQLEALGRRKLTEATTAKPKDAPPAAPGGHGVLRPDGQGVDELWRGRPRGPRADPGGATRGGRP